ncbi:glutathione S-transferase family protein [Paracoccus luteus]|uniref:glutathione S-transferase family protein n=1 Tax=Paracoccus luteus TaxID=2508543 RepID=UPI00106F15C5|nr:glutathione S-transferase family protein [Paracoccus luteus]
MPTLWMHPFSSYCQKVLIALYENGTAFTPRLVRLELPEDRAALAALWPLARFPVLVDGGEAIAESSIIIEHLDRAHPGPAPLVPADALEVRFMDRVFDLWVQGPMQAMVNDALAPAGQRSPARVDRGRGDLATAYRWLEGRLAGRDWAAGRAFSMADCAAAPALFYAHWVQPIPADLPVLNGYFRRLMARPSVARVVDEARPWRHLHPIAPAGDLP